MKISLTTFVEFLSASTPARRLAVVRSARDRYGKPFDVRTDFYGPLRKGLVAMHRESADPSILDRLAEEADAKKQEHYRACVAGYRRFIGRRSVSWVGARGILWTSGDLVVSVSPELVAQFDGAVVVAKLHFGVLAPPRGASSAAAHLLRPVTPEADSVGVLDVRRGRLLMPRGSIDRTEAVLHAEAASFVAMWNVVDDRAA